MVASLCCQFTEADARGAPCHASQNVVTARLQRHVQMGEQSRIFPQGKKVGGNVPRFKRRKSQSWHVGVVENGLYQFFETSFVAKIVAIAAEVYTTEDSFLVACGRK